MHKLGHPLGELNTTRAAKKKNIIYTLSSLSTTSFEEIDSD